MTEKDPMDTNPVFPEQNDKERMTEKNSMDTSPTFPEQEDGERITEKGFIDTNPAFPEQEEFQDIAEGAELAKALEETEPADNPPLTKKAAQKALKEQKARESREAKKQKQAKQQAEKQAKQRAKEDKKEKKPKKPKEKKPREKQERPPLVRRLLAALLITDGILLALAGAAFWKQNQITHTLLSVTAAAQFRGDSDTRFAQIACFLPVGEGKAETDVLSFRRTLESKFVEQSLKAPENGTLYQDAYCGWTDVSISGSNGASATVKAIGVGGHFFFFHPLILRSGAYIDEDDIMDDLVMLDEEMAWRLFGGVDLTGLTVTINGTPFVVGGVVARETDFATRRAYTEDGGIFMSYAALERLQTAKEKTLSISCYEIVLPDPITNYAMGLVKDNFSIGNGEIVENSRRYSFENLWTVAKNFGNRSMRANGVIYPYWENALRLTEDYASLLLILGLICLVLPAVTALVWGILSIRRGYRFIKRTAPVKWQEASEKRRERRWAQTHENNTEGGN